MKVSVAGCSLGVARLGPDKVRNNAPGLHPYDLFPQFLNLGLARPPSCIPGTLPFSGRLQPLPGADTHLPGKGPPGQRRSDPVQAGRRTAWKGHWVHAGQTSLSARSPGSRRHSLEHHGPQNTRADRRLGRSLRTRNARGPRAPGAGAQRSPRTARLRASLADSGLGRSPRRRRAIPLRQRARRAPSAPASLPRLLAAASPGL